MDTLTNERIRQIVSDFEIDAARHQRQEWQRAIDQDLHALADYVRDGQLIMWQPGVLKRGRGDAGYRAFDVQVVTTMSCTCQRYRLVGRCPHVAFARHMMKSGVVPGTDTPVRAGDQMESEEAA